MLSIYNLIKILNLIIIKHFFFTAQTFKIVWKFQKICYKNGKKIYKKNQWIHDNDVVINKEEMRRYINN